MKTRLESSSKTAISAMSSDSLLVSIVINNYNYEQFLPVAIDSALAQTYQYVEVLVVDDCSTDGSRDLISSYGDRIIPVFHEKNGKQGAAFNSGFDKSRGDIVIFLDADDYLYPSAVDQIVQAWQPDIAKVHYRLAVIDSAGNPRGFSYPQGNRLSSGRLEALIFDRGTYTGVPTSGNAISRKVLAQIMPIPAEFNTTSDDYLSVIVPLYGAVIAVEDALGAYRIHTSNQWAMTAITSDRFHRFIRHDMQRCQLLKEKGATLGYAVPEDLETRFFGRVWSRLSSLKFEPQSHPIASDRPIPLAFAGIEAVWRHSDHPWQKCMVFTIWFLWVGVMPSQLAKPAITWLFAPHLRPKPVHWTLSKIRTLVNS